MKLIKIIPLFLFFSMFSQKSDFDKYDKLVWKAMIQYKDQDFKNSLKNFKKAFKIIPNDSESDYFYSAAAALHLNNDEEAEKLIALAIELTNASKYYLLNFEEFNRFRSKKLFEKIINNYDDYRETFLNNLVYPEINIEVDSLVIKDQDVRNNGGEMYKTDLQNITRLIEITKKYGWQKKAWVILWHQRGTYMQENSVWMFFKPYINEQIASGKLRKDFWARFEDEASLFESKTQIYGLYWSQFEEFPIDDIENVDARRASVGLPPLWYMNKVYGIAPPKEYKKTTGNRR